MLSVQHSCVAMERFHKVYLYDMNTDMIAEGKYRSCMTFIYVGVFDMLSSCCPVINHIMYFSQYMCLINQF